MVAVAAPGEVVRKPADIHRYYRFRVGCAAAVEVRREAGRDRARRIQSRRLARFDSTAARVARPATASRTRSLLACRRDLPGHLPRSWQRLVRPVRARACCGRAVCARRDLWSRCGRDLRWAARALGRGRNGLSDVRLCNGSRSGLGRGFFSLQLSEGLGDQRIGLVDRGARIIDQLRRTGRRRRGEPGW